MNVLTNALTSCNDSHMNTNTTTAKVAARIVAATATHDTFRAAVTAAAFDAVQEAKAAGWSDKTIAGMMQTFATVAADMVAEAVAA